jgi:Pyruvate/2-oxoacid:ferredoxin oxidoreductase delta subunit
MILQNGAKLGSGGAEMRGSFPAKKLRRWKVARPVVDQDTCTGCGACVDLCPEVFELKDDKAQPGLRKP